MAETFAWPEGNMYLWTGAAGSAIVAYAESVQLSFQYGAENYQTLTGTYGNRYTGQRVDMTIGALHHPDNAALRVFADAKTAVHAHLLESSNQGSAGYYLWSGWIDTLGKAGQQNGLYTVQVNYHANAWSAY